jgi:heat shock protein HslJ
MSLDGSAWELYSLGGDDLIAGRSITLSFFGEEIRGNAGCNTYFGGYVLNRVGGFQATDIGLTAMACLTPEGVMQQETIYVQTLGSVVKAERLGNQLKLQDATGQDVLVFVEVVE